MWLEGAKGKYPNHKACMYDIQFGLDLITYMFIKVRNKRIVFEL